MAKSKKPIKPTPSLVKGLLLIRDKKIDMPSQFARFFWPSDHPGWKRRGKCGPSGSASGIGMRLAGGALLGKWEGWGLIKRPSRVDAVFKSEYDYYRLTAEGKAYLQLALCPTCNHELDAHQPMCIVMVGEGDPCLCQGEDHG